MITFVMQTRYDNGLILFATNPRGQYFSLEMNDGHVYFTHKFGDTRKQSQVTTTAKVSDLQPHKVS